MSDMPYMNGDGSVHQVLPTADQLARPRLRGTAIVQLCGSAVAALLAILARPSWAIVVLGAGMIPYGISVLAQRGRVLRGLHGGDEGALPAGIAAQLAGPVVAVVVAAAGRVPGAATVLAGAAMLAATAQAILLRPRERAARRAAGVLLLASVSFALGIVSIAAAGGPVLLVSLLITCAAVALGAAGATTSEMVRHRTSGSVRGTQARSQFRVAA